MLSKKRILRVISIILIQGLLVSNVAFALDKNTLSVPSRFWDDETVRSIEAGETNGKSFRNRVASALISSIIGDALYRNGISPQTLISNIKNFLGERELDITKEQDPMLAGFELDELTYDGEAYYIPLYRGEGKNRVKTFNLKYYKTRTDKKPDFTIPLGDGSNVYVDVGSYLLDKKESIRRYRKLSEVSRAQLRKEILPNLLFENSQLEIINLFEVMFQAEKDQLDKDLSIIENSQRAEEEKKLRALVKVFNKVKTDQSRQVRIINICREYFLDPSITSEEIFGRYYITFGKNQAELIEDYRIIQRLKLIQDMLAYESVYHRIINYIKQLDLKGQKSVEAIFAGSQGRDFTPHAIEFHPAIGCNAHCKKCPNIDQDGRFKKYRKISERLTTDRVKMLIDMFYGMGVRIFTFSGGGEPLVEHKDFSIIEVIKHVSEKYPDDISVGLYTNGLILTEMTDEELRILVTHLSRMRISIDAADAETWAEYKGLDSKTFDNIWDRVNKLVELRNDEKAKGNRCVKLGASCLVPLDSRDHRMLRFIETSLAHKLDFCDIKAFYGSLDDGTIDRYKSAELTSDINTVLIAKALGKYGNTYVYLEDIFGRTWYAERYGIKSKRKLKTPSRCWMSRLGKKVTIGPYGGVYPCSDAANPGVLHSLDYAPLMAPLTSFNNEGALKEQFLDIWVNTRESKRDSINPMEHPYCVSSNDDYNIAMEKLFVDWEWGIALEDQPIHHGISTYFTSHGIVKADKAVSEKPSTKNQEATSSSEQPTPSAAGVVTTAPSSSIELSDLLDMIHKAKSDSDLNKVTGIAASMIDKGEIIPRELTNALAERTALDRQASYSRVAYALKNYGVWDKFDELLARKELCVDGVPFEPETILDMMSEQQQLIKSGKPLEFGPGLLYHGGDGLDEAILNNHIPGGFLSTRVGHEHGIGCFEEKSQSPAIFVFRTRVFNELLYKGQATMGIRTDRSKGVVDPYPDIRAPLSLNDVEEIWIDEDTEQRYSQIIQNPTTDIERTLRPKLISLFKSGKIKVIKDLKHTTLSDTYEDMERVNTAIGQYMMDRNLFDQMPKFLEASRPIPESEQAHRTLLEDQAKLTDEPTTIIVGTSSFPGYDEGRYPMHHTMNPLMTSLNGLFKDSPVRCVIVKDDEVLSAVEKEKKQNRRVLVLAGKGTVQELDNIKKTHKIGIDSKNLLIDNYIPLMEMLTVLIKFSKEDIPEKAIKRIQEEHPTLGAQLIDGLIIFELPKAEPMDYEELREIYKLQTFA